ncbi:MAG: precorrin-6y C5,15-methyltransferase (decarboxylating) subunit CbiE [Nitrososphaera sp.]|uniref:Cobalt-precorrin-6Y C(5,15)-methyltransferase n=1 Tax=Nitrososphaera gargensis (strain Ga9.2) TaxID=1237085 RepID=K0IK39_NITGG|nr:precorrin-6y C5,15-methyltransferase (decarboxylating) subunit CbiE [Candidatus Nitrososphaera gargensis]AFU60500.1 cobalt-precorrin-6Y C(5,15)-methyltransferase [Candidatus Nitrososphaera gargensis Ga9.2]
MPKKLFVIGVGPGSPAYLTDAAKEAIRKSSYIIGYRYTLSTIEGIIDRDRQQVFEVTMKTQESVYQDVYNNKMKDGEYCTVPFTGDVNFSESEVVDRLLEIFGDDNVEVIPGISSIQVAAARARVPTDKALIVTFHVTGDIEQKKKDLLDAVRQGRSVILLPRPWPADPLKHFMQSEIAKFLRQNGVNTTKLKAWVFERLTTEKETTFRGTVADLEGKEFSDLSAMVIDQTKRQTYLEF